MATYGLDISKHQGALDFKAIAKENSFVILRIGYGVSGIPDQKDARFEEFYKKAKEAGLKIGGYYYSYAKTVAQAKQEANNCLKYIGSKTFDFPIFYDMEDPSIGKACKNSTITSMCNEFCAIIEKAGYKAGIYASTSWFKSHGVKDVNSKYVRWEANYGKNDGKTIAKSLYNKSVAMHQYTSKYKGKYGPNGKTVNVDRNINYSISASKPTTTDKAPATEYKNVYGGEIIVKNAQADKCNTQSRSRNGNKYHNKYSECLGKLGYKGINSNGVHTKLYSYGVVGHCCEGVQAHLIWAGYGAFVPKFTSGKYMYIWNTNVYHNWLKTEPTIKGYGKVDHVTDPKKAKVGAIAFTPSHTCIFIRYDAKTKYVYTVDFNVTGTVNGKKYNNGTVHKRKASKFNGFANMPYQTVKVPQTTTSVSLPKYEKNKTYTLQADMNVRINYPKDGKMQPKVGYSKLSKDAQKHATKDGVLKKGTKITCKDYTKISSTEIWVRTPSGWICGVKDGKIYIK